MSVDVYYQSEITNVYTKINTIVITLKGDIMIMAKKDDFIGIDMQEHNVRLNFKTIRYRVLIPHGDKQDIITNQLVELLGKTLNDTSEDKVDLYKELKERIDEVDSRADDAESEIEELREKCMMLEDTLKKMKAKAKAEEKVATNTDEVDLLGINT